MPKTAGLHRPQESFAIIGNFAPDGPGKRSEAVATGYRLIQSLMHDHRTPWGSVQRFHFGLFKKN